MTAVQTLRAAAALAICLAAQAASAACFSVYGADQELIYRSIRPPVDLAQPLHRTTDQLAPGARLVFSLDEFNCISEIDLLAERAQLARAREERQRAVPAGATRP